MPESFDEPALLQGTHAGRNKLAIMQPYFLPYLGYFQLINAVDLFVVYDNIKYTKKGWINRNRFLLNGKDALFTIPIAASSDFLDVSQKSLANDYTKESGHILARIRQAYRKAPQFGQIYPVIESIFTHDNRNLFGFIFHAIRTIVQLLDITTELIVSSSLDIDHQSKGVLKVLAICQKLQADTYINPIGGIELYAGQDFRASGVNLYFHNMEVVAYRQAGTEFISHLSIIDVLMFNSLPQVKAMLQQFKLLEPADIIHTGEPKTE